MRICDITQFYSPLSGGVRRYIQTKIDYIRDHTDDEHILIVPGPRNRVTEDGRFLKVEVASLPLPASQSYRVLHHLHRVGEVLAGERPDLLEVGDSYQLAWFCPGYAQELSIPSIAFYHSDYPRALDRFLAQFFGNRVAALGKGLLSRYLAQLYNRFNLTLVASRRMMRILRAYSVQRLYRCPLGTDIETFKPSDSRERIRSELGLSQAAFLLYVGRLSHEKYIDVLLESASILNQDGSEDYQVVLVGDGPLRNMVLKEQNRRNDVIWVPYVNEPGKLAEIYSAADLVVHPSMSETYGLSILEAEACGTPVVTVKNGGADDINLLGESFTAAASTPGEIARAVRGVLPHCTPDLRRKLRAHVEQHYGHGTCFERQFRIYRKLCSDPSGTNLEDVDSGDRIQSGTILSDTQI